MNGPPETLRRGQSSWRGVFRRMAGLTLVEWKLLLRSPILKLGVVVCWGLGVLLIHGVMSVQTRGFLAYADPADLTSGAIDLQIGLFAPSMLAFIAATSAARDRAPGVPETLYATPPSSEELVIGRFLAVLIAGSLLFAGILITGWLWLRYGEGISSGPLPFEMVGRSWCATLFYVLCLGYAAGLVLPGAAGGALVVFYLMASWIGAVFVSPVLIPYRGDTGPAYVLFGVAVVLFAAVGYQRQRRGSHREQSLPVGLVAAAALAGGIYLMTRAVLSYDMPPFHRDRSLGREARQTVTLGKALPPFHLYFTGRGRQLLTCPPGRPTLLILVADTPMILGALPPIRALAAAAAGPGSARLVLVLITGDPVRAAWWGERVSPGLETAALPGRLGHRPAGIAGALGVEWTRARFGDVAVLDSRGHYLGRRSLYELVRPRSLNTLIASLASGAPAPESTGYNANFQSEVDSARAFLQALRAYDLRKPQDASGL